VSKPRKRPKTGLLYFYGRACSVILPDGLASSLLTPSFTGLGAHRPGPGSFSPRGDFASTLHAQLICSRPLRQDDAEVRSEPQLLPGPALPRRQHHDRAAALPKPPALFQLLTSCAASQARPTMISNCCRSAFSCLQMIYRLVLPDLSSQVPVRQPRQVPSATPDNRNQFFCHYASTNCSDLPLLGAAFAS